MKHKRELVFVCTGSDCKKAGAKAIRKHLKEDLKSGPLKGQCKLIQTKCMDLCKSAPVVIVGDHFCKKTDAEKVATILKKSLSNKLA
ncbi:(2Fe-2S) ferredoxin domain-containing protein [Algoriphagus kandeliae]|uniref:(2Fe-2S) ferredoxin domain-containing protein n=1 Tax=Algoriphagus kandeliae TaxID=2562278 RepID=A0A4Y9R2K1_9BACT|nr:(2Fe-2S) ferredoxin domain-containing protein [Algoriphagus kandeliae]TFV97485.1 (2Fe-2S) ferredoxin domain-containing protein [Algoriphagus kandeliae]